MENKIREARDLLANSWCRGSYKTVEGPDNTFKFCSVGAIGAVAYGEDMAVADLSPEVDLLAEVIREQYMDRFVEEFSEVDPYFLEKWAGWEWVIAFNDDIAQSHAEIMAVFDKAAVRQDEINSLK